MTIFIIAAIMFAVAIALHFIRLFADGRHQRAKMHQRRVEDLEREAMMSEAWSNVVKKKDDGIDWERRYAELVETVASRTDQANQAERPTDPRAVNFYKLRDRPDVGAK